MHFLHKREKISVSFENEQSNRADYLISCTYVRHSSHITATSTCLPTSVLRFLSLWPVQHVASCLQIDSTSPLTQIVTTGLLLPAALFTLSVLKMEQMYARVSAENPALVM